MMVGSLQRTIKLPILGVDNAITPPSKTVPVDISPLSEMTVRDSFAKTHKDARPDGLSSSAFEEGKV